jgi:hypothetical protein
VKNCDELFYKEEFHAANGKVESCSQDALVFFLDALVFFLLSLGAWGDGRFFFQAVFGVESGPCPLGQWTFHTSFIGRGEGGGFVFLSANGKTQGALLLFLLSFEGKKDFFPFFPVSQCVLTMFILSS